MSRGGLSVRYADEFVGADERQEEAERVYPRLGQCLGQFGREHSAEKTRAMPCRRHPQHRRPAWRCWALRSAGTRTRPGKPRSPAEPPARRSDTPGSGSPQGVGSTATGGWGSGWRGAMPSAAGTTATTECPATVPDSSRAAPRSSGS